MHAPTYDPASPGTLVPLDGAWAFLPDGLPPSFAVSRELLLAVDAARGAVSKLAGEARLVSNLGLITRPLASREAVLSSRIEGTQTELRELVLREAIEPYGQPDADLEEVLNYLAALELGEAHLADRGRITLSLVRELHARLMQGVRGQDRGPGMLRPRTVFIGSRFGGIASARFVPPPPQHVPPLMDDFVAFVEGPGVYGPMVDTAIAHYQFETIHPFEDGNGRLGRLLIPLQMMRQGVLDRPILYLSAYFERHRSEYMDHLLAVTTENAWEAWVLFFLEAVREQASDTQRRVRAMLELRDRYQSLARERGFSRTAILGVDFALERVYFSVPQLQRHAATTYPTARAAVDALASAGIIAPHERVRGTQFWVAEELLRDIYDDLRGD